MRTGLSGGGEREYTSMVIVPPLLSRSGLLEVRLSNKGTNGSSNTLLDYT
jgi:hypothetical protein